MVAAHACLQAGQFDGARELLLKALELRNQFTDAGAIEYILTSLDSTWLFADRYDEAISFFSGYIDRHPQEPAAHRARAGNLWYAGRLEEAIHGYSRALELKKNDIPSLSGRGQIMAEIGRGEQAMADLDLALEAIKAAPTPNESWRDWYREIEAFVHNGRGLALAALGRNSEAMREFDVSIAMSPRNAWVYYNRAGVYYAAGDRTRARSDYQTALAEKNPALNLLRKERSQSRLRQLSGEAG
jgi:tetratricopeptide (TPR) repeat protein